MTIRTITLKSLAAFSLVIFGCVPSPAGSQISEGEKAVILSAARGKYYNLKQAGLLEFRANIEPNWDALLPDTEARSTGRALLNALHFSFSVDPQGQLRLEHHVDGAPSNQKLAEGITRTFKGMDESISSFFRTWSIFLLTSPFPPAGSDYTIQKQANDYKFLQQQGELNVQVTTDNDFMISEIRVTGPELIASLRPVLEKTAGGFLLKGYTANSERLSGARKTTVKALLEYETASGMQLLHKVSLDTVFQGVPAKMEWLFTGYQLKLR
ncbi:MAG: hypothetical protein ABR607_15095 [Pyrinomonadaceae bacterium]